MASSGILVVAPDNWSDGDRYSFRSVIDSSFKQDGVNGGLSGLVKGARSNHEFIHVLDATRDMHPVQNHWADTVLNCFRRLNTI